MRTDLADYHVHTSRCGHAEGTMEEYVEQALALGLAEIGFSDHLHLYWIPQEERDPGLAMAEEELPRYVESVLRLRERYPQIPIRLGLEADYIPGKEETLRRILTPYPWDYVYGSIHFIGEWGFDDPRYMERYNRWDVDELYRHYFGLVKDAAATGLFDIMGHLDVVKKFGHRPAGDATELYREVASALKAAGVAIEVSTAGLRKPVGEIYPAPALLAECARQGIPAGLGSDSHRPAEVGIHFDRALEALRAAGYRETVRFEARRRRPVPLPFL
ncbi:MAG: histidinol-phosphatase HisJ family protein [Sphingomonadaceae bacterium]